ncbi:MAG: hypothetical protein LBG15_10240, partial [Dysgonamonadaceae bacterium]|nr:hypothetical protein [Dysgonamonadaceae bacterium]
YRQLLDEIIERMEKLNDLTKAPTPGFSTGLFSRINASQKDVNSFSIFSIAFNLFCIFVNYNSIN